MSFYPSHIAKGISIHAAREGGDVAARMPKVRNDEISIHAAREGGDVWFAAAAFRLLHFNPRRP